MLTVFPLSALPLFPRLQARMNLVSSWPLSSDSGGEIWFLAGFLKKWRTGHQGNFSFEIKKDANYTIIMLVGDHYMRGDRCRVGFKRKL